MKRVYLAHDPADAHLVKGLLEAEGIPAVVQGEHLFALRGGIPVTADTSPSVWALDDGDFERARGIVGGLRLADGPHSAGAQRGAWRCLHCGETLEGQFTECWRCGRGRRPV